MHPLHQILHVACSVDRLNTRSMLLRKNYNVEPNIFCFLCSDNVEEDINHLFFSYPFASTYWTSIGVQWNMVLDVHERILETQRSFSADFFMEILVLASWEIWKVRNSIIFDNDVASFATWCRNFRPQVHLQLLRVAEHKRFVFPIG